MNCGRFRLVDPGSQSPWPHKNTWIYYENKNTLQLWDRRFRRNSSLQAVCDTPLRSRVLRVVCPHLGYRSATPLGTTSVVCIRVNTYTVLHKKSYPRQIPRNFPKKYISTNECGTFSLIFCLPFSLFLSPPFVAQSLVCWLASSFARVLRAVHCMAQSSCCIRNLYLCLVVCDHRERLPLHY